MGKLPLLEVPIVDYGEDEADMVRYRAGGRAPGAGARQPRPDPLRRATAGSTRRSSTPTSAHGFYIFEGVLGQEELDDIERDVADMLERAPVTKGAPLDRHGPPGARRRRPGRNLSWTRPLADPIGGTEAAHGRHPVKMNEPVAAGGRARVRACSSSSGSLQFSPACLRVYGHPQLLAVAAAVNGDDFVPFNEAVWIKHPGLGGSVAWHQDGWTHWDSPDLDSGSHGFNFMGQLYGCTAANGLWVVPGSHRGGKADIKAMVERGRLRSAARRRAARVRRPATWRSPTARRSTARSPTPAPTRGSRSTSASTAGARCSA